MTMKDKTNYTAEAVQDKVLLPAACCLFSALVYLLLGVCSWLCSSCVMLLLVCCLVSALLLLFCVMYAVRSPVSCLPCAVCCVPVDFLAGDSAGLDNILFPLHTVLLEPSSISQ
jgi:hypothetical protein